MINGCEYSNNSEYIKGRIEEERDGLNELVTKYGFRDVRVLKQSMELDKLINSYNRSRYHDNKYSKKPTVESSRLLKDVRYRA
ncbi:Spo0E like sporulation regulatory protein [compost metagenome]